MKTKGRPVETLGLRMCIGMGAIVGLIGGFLFGIRDCVTVILNHAPRPFPVSEMLCFSLYPTALYTTMGCLVMIAAGILVPMLVRAAGYAVNRTKLAGLYVGIFVLFAASVLGSNMTGLAATQNGLTTTAEFCVVTILCSIALGGLTVYILETIRKERLIALFISLSISLLLLLFVGLWMNINLLPQFWKPVSLLSNVGLLLLTGFLAICLYFSSLSVLQRHRTAPKRERLTLFSLLAAAVFLFVIMFLILPLSTDNVRGLERKSPLASNHEKPLSDSKERPNILWIVMDTVRADHLSCYGYHRKTTPNIDRIATKGVLFENAISPAPWTLPSHASMFTGMYPSKHGADAEHSYFSDKFRTIAEVLGSYGYRTFAYSNNPFVSPKYNLIQGFHIFKFSYWGRGQNLSSSLLINQVISRVRTSIGMQDGGAQKTNEEVRKWIRICHGSKTPFFIFINYIEPHAPYDPPRPYYGLYLEKADIQKAKKVNQNKYAYISKKLRMSDEDFEILRSLYDGEISYLDFRMNQLFDFLRQLNILDNTVIIITSDHGENIGDHELMGHILCVYDTLLHIPLIIRYPRLLPAGVRIQEQVQTTDIFPTILDLLHIDWSGAKEFQGRTLVPVVQQSQQDNSAFAIAELAYSPDESFFLKNTRPEFDASVYSRRLKAIRTCKFKYIWSSNGRDELYDIREDPGELNNLIETEVEKMRQLRTRLKSWLGKFEHYRLQEISEQNILLNGTRMDAAKR